MECTRRCSACRTAAAASSHGSALLHSDGVQPAHHLPAEPLNVRLLLLLEQLPHGVRGRKLRARRPRHVAPAGRDMAARQHQGRDASRPLGPQDALNLRALVNRVV